MVFRKISSCFWTFGFLLETSYVSMFSELWVFFYKLIYVFMFSGSGLLEGFLGFLKLMCLYIEVPKKM